MEKPVKGEISRSVFLKESIGAKGFLECEQYEATYTTKSIDFYESELISEQSFCYFLKKKNVLEAFIFYRKLFDQIEIIHWAVREKRKGLGKAFLEQFMQELKPVFRSIHLEVDVKNSAALSVYESFNFLRGPLRRAYYGEGKDALSMSRSL